MVSTFRNVVDFFNELGIYDVILPFLLVFSMVFALLEKTKILGVEKIGDKEYSRKSVNSMVAFTSAFFVVASSKAVAVINHTIANVFLLLLMAVLFLLVFGTFYGESEKPMEALGNARFFIGGAFAIGIILIFMDAIDWLEPTWDFLQNHWDSNAVASLILMAVVIFIMWFIVKSPSEKKDKEKK
jgi:small-conductance mechanosensitive channel